jgi:hypothetical protein
MALILIRNLSWGYFSGLDDSHKPAPRCSG